VLPKLTLTDLPSLLTAPITALTFSSKTTRSVTLLGLRRRWQQALLINCDQLEADILLCSAYKFFGPLVGIAVIREELFEQIFKD
jgi:hypothetical protein